VGFCFCLQGAAARGVRRVAGGGRAGLWGHGEPGAAGASRPRHHVHQAALLAADQLQQVRVPGRRHPRAAALRRTLRPRRVLGRARPRLARLLQLGRLRLPPQRGHLQISPLARRHQRQLRRLVHFSVFYAQHFNKFLLPNFTLIFTKKDIKTEIVLKCCLVFLRFCNFSQKFRILFQIKF